MKHCSLIVFAKAPVAGEAKTRLAPVLGLEGAARLAQRMLTHTLAQASAAALELRQHDFGAPTPTVTLTLCGSPEPQHSAWQAAAIPAEFERSTQGAGDLGQRMARAFAHHLGNPPGDYGVVLMGTDCPALLGAHITSAARALLTHDAAIVPVSDGGYVLLALRQCPHGFFADMPWSTPAVAHLTLARMAALGWRVAVLPTLNDIDEPADLQHLSVELATAWAVAPRILTQELHQRSHQALPDIPTQNPSAD